MMQDLARHLHFGAHQALQDGRGLLAELHALQLESCLKSEQTADPGSAPLLSSIQQQCDDLLARVDASAEAAEERVACLRAAAAAVGCADGFTINTKAPSLADALQQDTQWRDHFDRGRLLQQLVGQATRALQARLKPAVASADASSPQQHQQQQQQQHQQNLPPQQQQQQAREGEISAANSGGGGRPRQLQVATLAPKQQERKRDADGVARQQGTHGWGQGPAVQGWQPQQNQQQPQQQGHGGWEQEPDIIEDDDGPHPPGLPASRLAGPGGPYQQQCSGRQQPQNWQQPLPTAHQQQRQQHQQHQQQQQQQQQQQHQPRGGGGAEGTSGPDQGTPGASGFKTARHQYAIDLRKKGQHQQAASIMQGPNQAPRAGLTRPRGGRGGGGGGGGAAGGFVPPFVSKALDANGAGGGAAGGAGGEEGPLSARTLQMLGVEDLTELPPELQKCDPKLIDQVCNDVIDASGGISWDDIAGLQTAKDLIREIVVWPMLNPTIFTGPRAPPKGLLLFGPPGTGKTLIGKAIASNISASFFSISASSLTSKWIGEGEKMVRTLFAVAGVLQPSVIFIDEIDSLMSARKSDGEHEASRRLKTEMLVQMEGCDPSSSSRRVLLIGATNRPEELDEAARRRMPKQLYIPLPCAEARRQMVLRQLGPGGAVAADLGEADLGKLVEKTAGYSGSDMRNLIQEACQGPVREAVVVAGCERVAQLRGEDLRPVRLRDFQVACKAQRASVTPAEIKRYEEYNERHGAKYVPLNEGGQDAMDEDDW